MFTFHRKSQSKNIDSGGREIGSQQTPLRGDPHLQSAATVLIVGPPWARSGTARVMQNQVEYYRSRGYSTVLICVPLHCSYTATHPDWDDIQSGILEIGADRTFFAIIDQRAFAISKYVSWARNSFRGTALDWIAFTARSARLSNRIIELLSELPIVLVHVNHVFTFDFTERLIHIVGQRLRSAPIILETHDIQANALDDRGEINPWSHRRDSPKALLGSEMARLKKTKVLIHVSTDDYDFFKGCLPEKHHVLVLPTINELFVSEIGGSSPSLCDSIDLLFVGHSTAFNAAAMEWFFEEVWPLLVRQQYTLKIIGSVEWWIRKERPRLYDTYRSYFVGPVEKLAPIYRAARCVFAPMISGTGISMKTIEAFALGKPFVGTSKAFRGMPMDVLEESGIRAHDSPQDFANAIEEALSQGNAAAACSHAVYRKLFSNRASSSARDEALRLAAVSPAFSDVKMATTSGSV
jgi:glycosyltransferase involved in cell wall biosynthesis